jgi:hypothetical protein
VIALAVLVAWPRSAHAEPRELKYDLAVDVPTTVGLGALWFGSEALKGSFAPSACRWMLPQLPGHAATRTLFTNHTLAQRAIA